MATRHTSDNGRRHRFGGDWTTRKLDVLTGYLAAYTTALKDQHFRKGYIDAFAGTGYRDAPENRDSGDQSLLFPDLAEGEPQQLLDGSARRALAVEPPFDSYIFIEKAPGRCAQLEALRAEFPERAESISVRQRDANEEIRDLCGRNWERNRAVLFLDPYGMQVEWSTIEAIGRTRAIDVWLLFPLGIGVNRMLPKSGLVPPPWQKRLNLLLGTQDWYDEFYEIQSGPDLLGDTVEVVVKATMEVIGRKFIERLRSAFGGVVDEPGVLRNSKNSPLYLLCFAAGNERGSPIALRIANSLLKDLR